MTSRPKVILVVDDDDDVQEALTDILVDLGHAAIVARNGREALQVLDAQPLPSIILLDVMMPVMDGYEFLEEFRKNPRISRIPVVVLTTARVPDRERIGDVLVLTKPIDLTELQSAIRALS